ncbi:MAG: hypothetical protein KAI02_00225 [Gammaproteobacteria bacterium]|nr:hypothetical protein [Bacteroidales bacterium]MCK5696553.1 hypothetical protein [Gammaproteobacteria bacterium]
MMKNKLRTTVIMIMLMMITLLSLTVYADNLDEMRTNKTLESLLLPFTQISSIHFNYTEIRSSFFFKKKQISQGNIQYIKPDTIIKRIVKPHYKKIEIHKNKLVIHSMEKGALKVDINDYPQLKHFIHLIKSILNGNAHYISKYYEVSLDLNSKSFLILNLIPKKLPNNNEVKRIKSIHITINYDQINSIKILGFGGETSTLMINDILEKTL